MVDINLIPKEYKKREKRVSVVFSKTLGGIMFLLVLSLLLYGGLLWYGNKFSKELNSIRKEIALLEQKRNLEMEEAIVDLDKNLGVLKELFQSHLYWSKIFNKIEEVTVPSVYFSDAKLKFSEEDKKVNVDFSGNALTYTVLARQIVSFQEGSQVEKVEVSDISLNKEGGVNFVLGVVFSQDILFKK